LIYNYNAIVNAKYYNIPNANPKIKSYNTESKLKSKIPSYADLLLSCIDDRINR